MSCDHLAHFKASFDRSRIHLNNAGLSPISRQARDKLAYWAERFYRDGFFSDEEYAGGMEHSRALVARLIGAKAEQLAFFASTAFGVSQVAFSVALKPGDEVLLFDQEYGSNLFPWREACVRSGAKLVIAASGPDLAAPTASLLERLNSRTRVVAVSAIQYQTGAIVDLPAIVAAAARYGTLVCVDAMQRVGLMPFDMQALGVDCVMGGSHKWLASPVGVGYLGLSERLAAMLRPLALGSQSYGSCDLPTSAVGEFKNDASRLEPGSKAAAEIIALGASVDLILRTGVERIGAEVARLRALLRTGLLDRGYGVMEPNGTVSASALGFGGILTFTSTKASRWASDEAIVEALKSAGIAAPIRGGGVRLSPHAFNTEEDLDWTLAAL